LLGGTLKIPIFYRREMSCSVNSSYSPSADKPAKVVADWMANPSIEPYVYLEEFEPVTDETICLAHYPPYVKSVMACELPNGFGNKIPEVAQSLPFTVGSMVAAAKHAIENRSVAFSPSSGFHHAGHTYGEGFCTFNGLMVAALEMKRLGLVRNVLIIDGDAHFGDGTESCILATRSQKWIKTITASKDYETSDEFFSRINLKLIANRYHEMWDDIGSTLVIYQAGADAWEHDPVGSGVFTMEELRMRDERIFSMAHRYQVPLVVNLAGGYSTSEGGGIEPVLSIHRQTMQACIDTYHMGR
jgi:acetoin utilization deacetylase AcuC-like enzyme